MWFLGIHAQRNQTPPYSSCSADLFTPSFSFQSYKTKKNKCVGGGGRRRWGGTASPLSNFLLVFLSKMCYFQFPFTLVWVPHSLQLTPEDSSHGTFQVLHTPSTQDKSMWTKVPGISKQNLFMCLCMAKIETVGRQTST